MFVFQTSTVTKQEERLGSVKAKEQQQPKNNLFIQTNNAADILAALKGEFSEKKVNGKVFDAFVNFTNKIEDKTDREIIQKEGEKIYKNGGTALDLTNLLNKRGYNDLAREFVNWARQFYEQERKKFFDSRISKSDASASDILRLQNTVEATGKRATDAVVAAKEVGDALSPLNQTPGQSIVEEETKSKKKGKNKGSG